MVLLAHHLAAGHRDLVGVDDHDVVAEIDVRGVVGAVLTAQTQGDVGGQAAHNDAFGVDDYPLVHGISRFNGNGCACSGCGAFLGLG